MMVALPVRFSCSAPPVRGTRLAYEVAAGGVESMGQFKSWFFPGGDGDTSLYCRYNYKSLQTYSALMHFTGSIASIAASYFTQHWGRKGSMIIAGTSFLIGSIFQASSTKGHIWLLFIGRVCWGVGIGFGDHCAFIYTAEMAPPRWRGRLNTLVQLGTITGIVVANAINIATNNLQWGWRLSLGLAALPGTVLVMGGLFLPETPNSLVERGYLREARVVLQQVRGTKDVVAEFDTIVLANEALKGMENPWIAILRRRNRPQLILAIAMPFLQQWSGVNGVTFFAPQIFAGISSFGEGNQGPLIAAILVNGVQLIATIFTVVMVDKVGRRALLLSGSLLGFAAEVAVAIVLAVSASSSATDLPLAASVVSIVLVGLYSIAFGFSWGPIGWLLPSEIHDLNTRSAGQSITVFTQLMSGAVVTQTFLNMLCSLKWGIYIFFGAWQLIAILFTLFLVPETRGVPIEKAANFVRAHKVWRHVCYPGGIVPGSDDSTGGMHRLSEPPNQIAAEQQGITYLG
ncbi:species-specific tRNA processing, variant 2 [Trebouxia sp. C0010 RCD-2024]